MTKDFLGGLTVEWHPPRPRIVLDKQIGPEHWDTWKLAASTEERGTWTGQFTGTSRSHSNYFFCYNQSYFIQACLPLPFVCYHLCIVFLVPYPKEGLHNLEKY